MKLSEGVTIVTGGGAGIGAGVSRRLLAGGARVIAIARRPPEFAHERLSFVKADLADRKEAQDAALEIARREQILRIVHNSGVIRPALVEDATLEDLDYLTELHLGAMLTLVKAALPAMKAAKFGRIVGVSSRGALGLQTRTNYSATKAGMIGMLRSWALELGPHGITSNCVAPGPVESDMFHEIVPEGSERKAKLAEAIPVKRIGVPDDVAHAVAFFLAPDAGFITGQTLYVCGGTSIGSVVI
ncbi:MAG TPA: SDR family oxidoreductase [Parvularculaceae bacterium]|nr:SDR family oxidoreductase [Parvularculaceae bacterium]